MSINSKMTAIANPIRTLKGTSGAMGLDAMASNLGEVVNECDTQADLIKQIKTALADKVAGGVELPALENIELQSKTVTENGTVTPDAGKLLSSVVVNVPTGSSGSVIKTGTTTSGTINTGLSDIEQFFIYKESVSATGLIHLHYTKDATSRMYASAWSTSSFGGTKTITNGTGGVTVSGGTLTISATQAAQGALTSGVTYKWVAIGK